MPTLILLLLLKLALQFAGLNVATADFRALPEENAGRRPTVLLESVIDMFQANRMAEQRMSKSAWRHAHRDWVSRKLLMLDDAETLAAEGGQTDALASNDAPPVAPNLKKILNAGTAAARMQKKARRRKKITDVKEGEDWDGEKTEKGDYGKSDPDENYAEAMDEHWEVKMGEEGTPTALREFDLDRLGKSLEEVQAERRKTMLLMRRYNIKGGPDDDAAMAALGAIRKRRDEGKPVECSFQCMRKRGRGFASWESTCSAIVGGSKRPLTILLTCNRSCETKDCKGYVNDRCLRMSQDIVGPVGTPMGKDGSLAFKQRLRNMGLFLSDEEKAGIRHDLCNGESSKERLLTFPEGSDINGFPQVYEKEESTEESSIAETAPDGVTEEEAAEENREGMVGEGRDVGDSTEEEDAEEGIVNEFDEEERLRKFFKFAKTHTTCPTFPFCNHIPAAPPYLPEAELIARPHSGAQGDMYPYTPGSGTKPGKWDARRLPIEPERIVTPKSQAAINRAGRAFDGDGSVVSPINTRLRGSSSGDAVLGTRTPLDGQPGISEDYDVGLKVKERERLPFTKGGASEGAWAFQYNLYRPALGAIQEPLGKKEDDPSYDGGEDEDLNQGTKIAEVLDRVNSDTGKDRDLAETAIGDIPAASPLPDEETESSNAPPFDIVSDGWLAEGKAEDTEPMINLSEQGITLEKGEEAEWPQKKHMWGFDKLFARAGVLQSNG
jgi:hypothetical protein